MYGRIIDLNETEAFISFEDGTTLDVGKSHIPKDCKIGDRVNIDKSTPSTVMMNDKINNLM